MEKLKGFFVKLSDKFSKLPSTGVTTFGGTTTALFIAIGVYTSWCLRNKSYISEKASSKVSRKNFYLKALVHLARASETDIRFFRFPKIKTSEVSVEEELRALLSHLPLWGVSEYMKDLTSYALHVEDIADAQNEARCHDIVAFGGLPLLLRIASEHNESDYVMRLVLRIVGNVAVHCQAHQPLATSGWIDTLARLMRSHDIVVSLLAARALANLDPETNNCSGEGSIVYEDGLYLMHPIYRDRVDIDADVIFIHGLLGGPFRTWRQDDSMHISSSPDMNYTQCWPKDWLCDDLSNLRVISIEYDTFLSYWLHNYPQDSISGTLGVRGSVLLEKLKKAGVGNRPIIWVGHSMGGLLIKQILTSSLKDLASRTCGIIFYSVPHHGSKIARMSKLLAFLAFPSVEVQELSEDSDYLKRLQQMFSQWVARQDVPCLSFVESIRTLIAMKIRVLLVPRDSADVGFGELNVLPADHVTVCKPESRESLCYAKTLNFITQCIERARYAHEPVKSPEDLMDVLFMDT